MSPARPTETPARPRLRSRAWLVLAFAWVLSVWLAPVPLARAAGDYLVDVWSGENGLVNSSVTSVAQTPDGYLWAGTYNGLARFDGVRFVNFDPFTTPELANTRIRRLFVDELGTLWINTFDGSLTSWHGRFKLEWKGDDSPDAWISAVSLRRQRLLFLLHTGELLLRNDPTNPASGWTRLQPPGYDTAEQAVEDSTGTVWCHGRDQKLWWYRHGTFEPAPADPLLAGQIINALVVDHQGRLWAGTHERLLRWETDHFVDATPTNGERPVNIRYLQPVANGGLWVLTTDRLRLVQDRRWTAESVECRGVFTGRLDRLSTFEDHANGIYLCHYGRGLYHLDRNGRTQDISAEENFPGERVDCFFQDREGNLWAGVDRGGLVRIRERRFSVLSPGDESGPHAAVSVAEDSQGAIWVGTYGAGLYRYADQDWQRINLPTGSADAFVFSVCPERDGRVWVSAGEEDLLHSRGGQLINPAQSLHGVKCLLHAHDDRLWVGLKFFLEVNSPAQPEQFTAVPGIDRVDIRALAEDRQGRIWAGAGNGTLYCLSNNVVTAFRPTDARTGQPIWSLLADPDGSIWVGTFRGGLLRFRDGTFTRFTSQDGLPDDVICQLLEDDENQLWVGCQKGIFRVAKAQLDAFARGAASSLDCTAYGRYDGLPSVECSGNYQPACWRCADGRLLFTTLKGVVAVRPGGLTANHLPPPVAIEEAVVDGTPQPFDPDDPARLQLDLAPGKRQLEVRYTGLSFVSPDRVRFRYRLDGLDRNWVEAGTRRTAQYSFLRPGSYHFRVLACNNDGVWNPTPASLLIVVHPHFYETAWFILLSSVGGLVLLVLGVRQSVLIRVRRRLEFLERQRAVERDRTRIAKDIHDDLGAGLTHISLLTELARRSPPEETNTHLVQISDMARELTRGMDEIVWAVDPQNDTLDGLINYLCKFAQEYLSVAGIRCRLDLPAQMPPWNLRAEIRHNLFLAFKETLNNLVKHSGATEVWLRLALGHEEFTLTVEDNGRGLGTPRDADAKSPGRISSGHGLGNLNRRLEAIGGRYRAENRTEPGVTGTRVQMMVHLGPLSQAPQSVKAPNLKW